MITDSTIEESRQGRFARVQLRGGPTIDRFAAADPEDHRLIRIDSLVTEDDGSLSRLSLRLLPGELASVEVLVDAPRFHDADGSLVVMPESLWPGRKVTPCNGSTPAGAEKKNGRRKTGQP